MRSSAGVGMTPPNVPLTPYPWSSVMMSRMFGAPLGGTTVGGHQVFDSLAVSLITPPNFGGDGGSCLPSIVIVALGDPSVPFTCWAFAPDEKDVPTRRRLNESAVAIRIMSLLPEMTGQDKAAQLAIARSG